MGESLTFTCVDEFFVKRVYFSCEHGGRTLRDEGAMCDAYIEFLILEIGDWGVVLDSMLQR